MDQAQARYHTAAMAEWKEIQLPALQNLLSTHEAQPLAREQWPEWTRATPDFVAAWYTPLDAPLATSSGTLSSGHAQASIDMERTDSKPPLLRYYRYVYCKMVDGRIFQAGPFKDLEYERHRNERPPWLASYRSTST
jgi:hypothetical protein